MAEQQPNALEAWMAHIDQAQAQPKSARGRDMVQQASQKAKPETSK